MDTIAEWSLVDQFNQAFEQFPNVRQVRMEHPGRITGRVDVFSVEVVFTDRWCVYVTNGFDSIIEYEPDNVKIHSFTAMAFVSARLHKWVEMAHSYVPDADGNGLQSTALRTWVWALISLSILVLVLIAVRSAKADDLLIGQRTIHFHDYINEETCGEKWQCEKFNDKQPLIGYATDKYALIYMHRNSIREHSIVMVRTYKMEFNRYLRPFTAVGFATGYADRYDDKSVGDITPMTYFGLDIHPANDRFGLVLTYQHDSFVGIGTRIKL
jgi:hypothetical protein